MHTEIEVGTMADKSQDTRYKKMSDFVSQEHFRYRRLAGSQPNDNEFVLKTGLTLSVCAQCTPLIEQTIADFIEFCDKCLEVKLNVSYDRNSSGALQFRLKGTFEDPYDVLNPAGETFTYTVSSEGIVLEAAHERGLLHGSHYLERLMADRGAPFLAFGTKTRSPRFIPRITHPMAVASDQREANLSMLSHFGTNGITVGVDLWKCSLNSIIKEFNSPDYEQNIEHLNREIALYHKHGFDSYLCVHNSPMAEDHPAFLTDPNRRGAPYRVFDDLKTQYVLCSSNPEVLACQEEAMESLYRSLPGAAGTLLLVGGEGYMHCYSRPYGKFEGYSSCPHCQDKAPSGEVANLVNRLAAAVKRTGQLKPFFAWPYSAFTWSGSNDRAQIEWMGHLSDDVLVHANFDTGSEDKQNKAGVFLYDYNIKSIGPSDTFKAQAEKSAEMGKRIYTKIESNCTPSVHFDAYIPVHFRWHQRFQEMAKVGVAGYQNQWAFFGPNGSPPEEMQYHAVWNPEISTEELLTRVALRDFGISRESAAQAVEAWRVLSNAWDDFPYSAFTNGEREFYMRGPLHYGPAHPLIFNTQHRYWLSRKFYGLSGDLVGLATPEELEVLMRDAKPRYVSELLMTLPYGIPRYLELLTSCSKAWAKGVTMLKQAIGDSPSERAQMELDICETLEIHFVTMENVVRFYDARDRLGRMAMDLPAFRNTIDELSDLLRAEIANAERSLPILSRDFRIATYDTDMVLEKLRQCHYVLEDELPIFDVTTRFHIWNDFL